MARTVSLQTNFSNRGSHGVELERKARIRCLDSSGAWPGDGPPRRQVRNLGRQSSWVDLRTSETQAMPRNKQTMWRERAILLLTASAPSSTNRGPPSRCSEELGRIKRRHAFGPRKNCSLIISAEYLRICRFPVRVYTPFKKDCNRSAMLSNDIEEFC